MACPLLDDVVDARIAHISPSLVTEDSCTWRRSSTRLQVTRIITDYYKMLH